ncbi:MAG: cation:proton antiporter [Clostridia bacterium]|nr:cation:proton antiporter [Clostridia bacterium]
MQFLITVSIAMLAGLLMTRLTKIFNLPAVTAYLLAGLVIGPFLLGAIDLSALGLPFTHLGFSKADFGLVEGIAANPAYEVISNVALGFIAFAIGNEFRMSDLKAIGKQATVIGILQALAAAVLVDIALIALHFAIPDILTVPAAIILGAIATATAPAATLMVVRQYKAKGKLTDLLLPIVALDDAVGLVVFSVSFGIAKALSIGSISLVSVLVNPLLEVLLSLLLGFVMGYLFTVCERFFHSGSKRMALSITFVLLTVALSMLKFEIGEVHIGFSSLLVCMMLGTVFCNMCDFSADIMERADKWTAPIFVLFFVLSGAELRLDILASGWIILIGVVYILARAAGKYFGAMGSAKLTKCDPEIQKYLGITLLPQAGVALGMSAIVIQDFPADGVLVRNIVLFSVLVLELVGPVLTKWALTRSGDIKEKTTEGFDRAKFLQQQAELEQKEQAEKAAKTAENK